MNSIYPSDGYTVVTYFLFRESKQGVGVWLLIRNESGSIPDHGASIRCVHIMVIISDCLSEDGSSILPRIAKYLLGYSLVWPKATVFEIVITGSNPVTSAKLVLIWVVNAVVATIKV